MRRQWLTCLLVSIAAGAFPLPARATGLGNQQASVVKLFVTQQYWDLSQPWTKYYATKATCTGFFIREGLLTNGHCVADATFIEVEIEGVSNKIEAEVHAVNHQVDLALLKLKGDSLPSLPKPIALGTLPHHRDKVVTVGFPKGGRQISYTEGVISRIDILPYAHSRIPWLLVQTDAAINPGNSGGPVFSDRTGECLGVSTQTNKSGEGLGYFIPTPVIRQFLADLVDRQVDGIGNLGVGIETLENGAFRRFLGLRETQTGVVVKDVARGSSADGTLEVGDVILEIEGHGVLNDGQVKFQDGAKIGFDYFLVPHAVGGTVPLAVLRKGKPMKLSLKLKPWKYSVIPPLAAYDRKPRYIVKGGMVFLAVEPRYFWTFGGSDSDELPPLFRIYQSVPAGFLGHDELVVISQVYDATSNKGYGNEITRVPVATVNGHPIPSLEALARSFEQEAGAPYLEIVLENGTKVVLDTQEIAREDPQIRARYNIQ